MNFKGISKIFILLNFFFLAANIADLDEILVSLLETVMLKRVNQN